MLELSPTSATTGMTVPPGAASAPAVAVSACASRPNNATAAPAWARADASELPMPPDAPVTTATLPSSEKSCRSMAGLFDIRTPAAESRDVGGAGRGVVFANESRNRSAILQFDLADTER